MKRRYIYTVDATVSVVVDSPERNDDLAGEKVHVYGLCHQCSDNIELGDIIDLIEVVDEEDS